MRHIFIFAVVCLSSLLGQDRNQTALSTFINACTQTSSQYHLTYSNAQVVRSDLGVAGYHVTFTSPRAFTLDESRYLFVLVTQSLLKAINQSPELKKQMASYPFFIQNLKVKLEFAKEGSLMSPPYIAEVSSDKKDVLFYTYNSFLKEWTLLERDNYSKSILKIEDEMHSKVLSDDFLKDESKPSPFLKCSS